MVVVVGLVALFTIVFASVVVALAAVFADVFCCCHCCCYRVVHVNVNSLCTDKIKSVYPLSYLLTIPLSKRSIFL